LKFVGFEFFVSIFVVIFIHKRYDVILRIRFYCLFFIFFIIYY